MAQLHQEVLQEVTKKSTQPEVVDNDALLLIEQSLSLRGEVALAGAKNAVLVIMASLVLTSGKSIIENVPCSTDVFYMIDLLQDLGAHVTFFSDHNRLEVDTSCIKKYKVKPEIMKKMRASVLVMGPLLMRFGKVDIALPGGCRIGARPIDFHIKGFVKMGVHVSFEHEFLYATASTLKSCHIVLEYPSIGATENIMMAAVLIPGTTRIVNAALEPEVLDLITVLKKMGANIIIEAPATIVIEGVSSLKPVEHRVMNDRLETGALLLAAAITGGSISLPDANPHHLDVFLGKLEEMGHYIECGATGRGINLVATQNPRAVSFITAPYPGFPTDLQAPMMAALCLADGKSVVHETVFENRLLHVAELQKMGAQITLDGDRATITGVDELYGTNTIAPDIRASCSLVLAGLAAKGTTVVAGIHHWRRGYEFLENKLVTLGATITLKAGS